MLVTFCTGGQAQLGTLKGRPNLGPCKSSSGQHSIRCPAKVLVDQQSWLPPPLLKFLLFVAPQILGNRVSNAFALLVTDPMLTCMP